MRTTFTKHPASVGETYFQHMRMAGSFGTRMLGGALACYVHAIFPFLFEKTGSAAIAELHDRMLASRRRAGQNVDGRDGVAGESRAAA
jgi:hypothetical protein